jgi:hypothetical protein
LEEGKRVCITALPVLFEAQTNAVIELASAPDFDAGSIAFLELRRILEIVEIQSTLWCAP